MYTHSTQHTHAHTAHTPCWHPWRPNRARSLLERPSLFCSPPPQRLGDEAVCRSSARSAHALQSQHIAHAHTQHIRKRTKRSAASCESICCRFATSRSASAIDCAAFSCSRCSDRCTHKHTNNSSAHTRKHTHTEGDGWRDGPEHRRRSRHHPVRSRSAAVLVAARAHRSLVHLYTYEDGGREI